MKKNILYLTYDGLSDPLGQSQILPYLEGLADKGHKITVISFEKSIFTISAEDNLQKMEALAHRSSKLNVIPLKYHKSPPVLSTLLDLYILKHKVAQVLKSKNIDIMHCRSYITSLIGLWAKRKCGVRFIFDMRGFWADERVEGGIWDIQNPLFKWIYTYFKKKEKQFIREADSIISLTNNAKREILTWNIDNLASDKISIIPTCADLFLFDPAAVKVDTTIELQKKYNINPKDFVLLYLGSLGTWYMLQEMLDFYDVLRTRIPNTKFLFLTRDQDILNHAIKERKYAVNEIISTSAAREDVPGYISISSASIFFIIPTFSKKASSATKMAEIMAMGKPIITNSDWGDVDEIITQDNGIILDNFAEDSYTKGVSELKRLINTKSTEIRQTAEQYFSLEHGITLYDNTYQSLSEKEN